MREGELVERPNHYRIDAELGRLGIDVFEIQEGSRKVFSSGKDVLPETGSREAYKTPCFQEVLVLLACDESFRKCEHKLNRVLRRDEKTDAVQSRTIANVVEREGELIQEHLRTKSERILKSNGFDTDGKPLALEKAFEPPTADAFLPQEMVCQMIEELNEGKGEEQQIQFVSLHETFENPEKVKANISLDDVCCKKQKAEGRKKGSPSKATREMVNNTVAHIQSGASQTYTLNTSNITHMMIVVLAFLLNNGLLSQPGQVVFFIDGARDLRVAIEHLFGFLSFKIILDWYHLEKKCRELLSMALNGKQVRNQVLVSLLARLWLGKVDMAIQFLRDLSENKIKNTKELERLIGYFERNRNCIPCYALRQRLGLRVSSNPVEKANDLVVSNRQKHNGMSWSASGSTSLATVTSVWLNAEQSNWLLNRNINFTFHADTLELVA